MKITYLRKVVKLFEDMSKTALPILQLAETQGAPSELIQKLKSRLIRNQALADLAREELAQLEKTLHSPG